MNSPRSFKQDQIDFAAHIRNPKECPAPDQIEDRRMAIYRDLFINSIAGLLEGSFPVIRTLYNEQQWKELVRGFYQKDYNKTPHFPEIPREFVSYLKNHNADDKKPFLYELAHYEWLELHLEKHSTEINKIDQLTVDQLLTQIPQVSPLVKLQAYQFPVHLIKSEYQPDRTSEATTLMLIWRNKEHRVKFAELNPFSAILLEALINNNSASGEYILQTLGRQHQHPDLNQFIKFGSQMLEQWYQQDIILSTKTI